MGQDRRTRPRDPDVEPGGLPPEQQDGQRRARPLARRRRALRQRRHADHRHVPARAQDGDARPAGQRRRPARRAARRGGQARHGRARTTPCSRCSASCTGCRTRTLDRPSAATVEQRRPPRRAADARRRPPSSSATSAPPRSICSWSRATRALHSTPIAAAAGTTKATLYARFGSKEALFLAVLHWATQRPDWPVEEPPPPDLDDLEAALTEIAMAAVAPQPAPVDGPARTDRHRPGRALPGDRPPSERSRRRGRAGRPSSSCCGTMPSAGTIVADEPEILAEHFLAMVSGSPARLASFGMTRSAASNERRTRHRRRAVHARSAAPVTRGRNTRMDQGWGSITRSRWASPALMTSGCRQHLDRERHHAQRVQELQQPGGVVGQVVEREPVAVGDRLLGTREEGVVERLHLVHRAGQPLRPPLGLGRPGTTSRRTARGRRTRPGATPSAYASTIWCSRTQSPTVLWKWRTRISWSFSGNVVNARTRGRAGCRRACRRPAGRTP